MKTKGLVCVISFLLMLGFSSYALAGWETDPATDVADVSVADYDILAGMLELYPDGAGLEEYANVCVQMGTSMPAMLSLSANVDNNTATGSGVLMSNLMTTCTSGLPTPAGRIKPYEGPYGADLVIYMFLRDQDAVGSSTAYASDCKGPPEGGSCMLRGAACSGCNEADCYEGGNSCNPGDADCYLRDEICTGCGEDNCSVLSRLCTACETSCEVYKRRGEWVANPMGGGGGQTTNPTSRGRFTVPLPPGPEQDENSYCFKLPWKMIIEEVALAAINDTDYTAAADPANVKWELTAWYNVNRADDLITGMPEAPYTCVNVTDTMPNDANLFTAQASDGGLCHHYQQKFHCCMGKLSAGRNLDLAECKTFNDQGACEAAECLWSGSKCIIDVCLGNLNNDKNVDALDVDTFLTDFGRSVFSNSCPCF